MRIPYGTVASGPRGASWYKRVAPWRSNTPDCVCYHGILVATNGLFPSRGMHSPDAAPDFFSQGLDVLHHLVLPCVTLLVVFYAQYMLVMRSSLSAVPMISNPRIST